MVKQSICVCEKPLKKPAAAGSLTLIAGQARQLKPSASGVSFFVPRSLQESNFAATYRKAS